MPASLAALFLPRFTRAGRAACSRSITLVSPFSTWRVLGVSVWALLLGTTVSFIRGRVLKDTGREVEPATLPDGQPFIERRKRDEF